MTKQRGQFGGQREGEPDGDKKQEKVRGKDGEEEKDEVAVSKIVEI